MSADRRRPQYLRAEEIVERFRGKGVDVRRAHSLMRKRTLPGVQLVKNGARVVDVEAAERFFNASK
ncbi:MAG: hypothetical protein ABW223_10825 [Rariglobus sp.]